MEGKGRSPGFGSSSCGRGHHPQPGAGGQATWVHRVLGPAALFSPNQTQPWMLVPRGGEEVPWKGPHTLGDTSVIWGTERLGDLPLVTRLGIRGLSFSRGLSDS